MKRDGVEVEALPEIKISKETFDALGEINGEDLPPAVNGSTWKRRIRQGESSYAFVICRYRTTEIGGPITIEMLRPVVTGPVGLARGAPRFNPAQGKKKR